MSFVPLRGFIFMPTDKELLGFYLKKKVVNEPLPWNLIVEKDLYGDKSPWELFNDDDAWINDDDDDGSCSSSSKKQHIYCFTRLKKASKNGKKNVFRGCGCGQWHGETGALRQTDYGSMKLFVFKLKPRGGSSLLLDEEAAKQYRWLMHQYSLSDEALAAMGVPGNDIVICKITRVQNKRTSKKQAEHHLQEATSQSGVGVDSVLQGGHLGGILGKRKHAEDYVGDDAMGSMQTALDWLAQELSDPYSQEAFEYGSEKGECANPLEDNLVDRSWMEILKSSQTSSNTTFQKMMQNTDDSSHAVNNV